MGAEKFFDIKCRASGLRPDAAVIVATIRALKMHGGVGRIVAGKPLDPALAEENVDAVRRGAQNLAAQIETIRTLQRPGGRGDQRVPDRHPGARWLRSRRSPGRRALAMPSSRPTGRTVVAAPRPWPTPSGRPPRRAPRTSEFLYPDDAPLRDKIEAIATRIYGADGVEYQPAAAKALKLYEELGFGHLPVCMAKTQYSLSHDANLKGRPTGFTLPIREVRLSAGAGFITPALRRDADDARAAVEAGRREHRHRRRREHRRPVLERQRGQATIRESQTITNAQATSRPATAPTIAGPPGRPVDRPERLVAMAVVVVTVRLSVIAEPVRLVRHRRVAGVVIAHPGPYLQPHSGR